MLRVHHAGEGNKYIFFGEITSAENRQNLTFFHQPWYFCLFIPRAVKGHCTKKDPANLSFALIHHPKQYIGQSWYYTTWPNGVSLFVRSLPRPPSSSKQIHICAGGINLDMGGKEAANWIRHSMGGQETGCKGISIIVAPAFWHLFPE